MDPVSIFVFLAGSLGATAWQSRSANPEAERYLIRDLAVIDGQWKFSELCSRAALDEVCDILDLGGVGWWPSIQSGSYRVFLLSDLAGSRHVLMRLVQTGDAWSLDEAYGPSGIALGADQRRLIRSFFSQAGSAATAASLQGGLWDSRHRSESMERRTGTFPGRSNVAPAPAVRPAYMPGPLVKSISIDGGSYDIFLLAGPESWEEEARRTGNSIDQYMMMTAPDTGELAYSLVESGGQSPTATFLIGSDGVLGEAHGPNNGPLSPAVEAALSSAAPTISLGVGPRRQITEEVPGDISAVQGEPIYTPDYIPTEGVPTFTYGD